MPLLEIKSLNEIEISVNKTSSDTKIPKNIFQSWETEVIPEIVYERVQKMKEENPDWKYFFFNSDLRRDFIQRHFDQSVLYAYDNLIPGAYKVDLWQFCILSKFGGLYLDMKCMPLVKINQIVDSSSTFIASRDRYLKGFAGDFYIYTAYLFSQTKHPFLIKAIEEIKNNVNLGYYGSDQLLPTGPGLLGKALNLTLSQQPHSMMPIGTHFFQGEQYTIYPTINMDKGHGVDFNHNPIIDLGYGKVKKSLIQSLKHSFYQKKLFDYGIRWHCGWVYKNKKKQACLLKRIGFVKNKFDLYLSCSIQFVSGLWK